MNVDFKAKELFDRGMVAQNFDFAILPTGEAFLVFFGGQDEIIGSQLIEAELLNGFPTAAMMGLYEANATPESSVRQGADICNVALLANDATAWQNDSSVEVGPGFKFCSRADDKRLERHRTMWRELEFPLCSAAFVADRATLNPP